MTQDKMGSSKFEPSSRYKLIRELIEAARSNGDYYEADDSTNDKEKEVVVKVDRWIAKLLKRK